MMSEEKTISLEDRFTELDEIISKMEDGSISLDESFELYKSGLDQVKAANEQLDAMEKAMLVLNSDGELVEFGE